MKRMRELLFILVCYAGIALISYGALPKTFFQQDEWAIFGYHISADKLGLNLFNRLFIHQQETHLNPLSNLVTLIEFRLFGVQFAPYAWVAIGMHITNAVLVYILSRLLTKRRWVALTAGAFFLINSNSHQAISWIATTTGTAGSTLFFLLSTIAGVGYIQGAGSWLLGLSMVGLVLSLGFKETTILGFMLIPILWFMLTKKRLLAAGVRVTAAVGISGLFYMAGRFILLAMRTAVSISPEVVAQQPLVVYVFRLVTTPVRVFVQSFVPQNQHLILARLVVRLGYPQFMVDGAPNPYLVESVVADIITFVAFLGISMAVIWVWQYFQHTKQVVLSKRLVFICIAIVLSALPLVFIPGRAGYNALLDGRHLYLTSVFASILIALMAAGIVGMMRKSSMLIALFCGIALLAGAYHIRTVRRDILYQVAVANLRQSILQKVLTSTPTLPKRAVFYVESDSAYYGVTEPIVPFQSGFGQVLLVWYNAAGADFPACLFENQYLYIQMQEDFKECEGRGFGYFRKKTTLNEAMRTYKFLPDEVFAFRFTSATNGFEDITPEVRATIRAFRRL